MSMRESCHTCSRKHIANAIVLSHEVVLGYKDFAWLVVGHLCQAEEEITRANIFLASTIRSYRLQYIECIEEQFVNLENVPNFMHLIEMITTDYESLKDAPAIEIAQPDCYTQTPDES